MDDFTPSQDYAGMWREAKKLKNIDRMDELFNQLCFEVGIYDPKREKIDSEAARKAAEAKNARDAGIGGKKI